MVSIFISFLSSEKIPHTAQEFIHVKEKLYLNTLVKILKDKESMKQRPTRKAIEPLTPRDMKQRFPL